MVPAYNEEVLIRSCLQSISAEAQRTQIRHEIIVVDNASTDRTAHIAGEFPDVIIIKEPKRGLVYSRMAGHLASHGHLVANVDADNILPQCWLNRVLTAFALDHSLVALSGPLVYYDISYISRLFVRVFYSLNYILYCINCHVIGIGSMLQGGNFVVRRDALDKIDGYSLEFPFYGEDTDTAWRLHKIGKVQFSWSLPIFSSGRRLLKEGIVKVGILYALNFIWAAYFRHPFTREWTDVRTQTSPLTENMFSIERSGAGSDTAVVDRFPQLPV